MNDSLLMACFDAELVWDFHVWHQNTGGFKVEAKVSGLLSDETGINEVHGLGTTLDAAVAEVSEWLGKLIAETRGVAEGNLRRLQAVTEVTT